MVEKRRQRKIRTKWSDEQKKYEERGNPFYGQTHTPETRERLKQARINKNTKKY